MAQVEKAKNYARISYRYPLPPLIEVQLESFKRLKETGVKELFHEISPIESYNGKMKLYFPSETPEANNGNWNTGLKIRNILSRNASNVI